MTGPHRCPDCERECGCPMGRLDCIHCPRGKVVLTEDERIDRINDWAAGELDVAAYMADLNMGDER